MSPINTQKSLKHIAFIMDGNGRWAEEKGKPRTYGHKEGAKNIRTIIDHVLTESISFLTLYAFSTENWKRSGFEVAVIMRLLKNFTTREVESLVKNDIRVRFIGRRDRIPSQLCATMKIMEDATAGGTAMLLQVAVDYGGRDELVRAFEELRRKQVTVITEEDISQALDTAGIPDPDLIIRTGGNNRTSNFLPWQAAYAEWYFTETLWPELKVDEVSLIIDLYHGVERRFGGMSAAAE